MGHLEEKRKKRGNVKEMPGVLNNNNDDKMTKKQERNFAIHTDTFGKQFNSSYLYTFLPSLKRAEA